MIQRFIPLQLIQTIRKNFVPIHKEGYPFIAGFVAFSLVGWLISVHLFWIGLIFSIWCAFFFRDPARTIPINDKLVISPADGLVSAAGLVIAPPELGLGAIEMIRISVFMNVFCCHVNRAPVSGKIIRINYIPGKFLNADLDKSSVHNERNCLVIESPYGEVGVTQIAGLIARRIVCWKEPKSIVKSGERFGLIRFGSRVDVFLPLHAQIRVSVGQTAVAGETILAEFGENSSPLSPVWVS